MSKVRNTALDLLLRYLSSKPMERLPGMLMVAEKLDRGQMHAGQIQGLRALLLEEDGIWRRTGS